MRYFKILSLIAFSLIFLFLISIPVRNYLYRKSMSAGDNLLAERNYTLAFVKFEKAAVLRPSDDQAESRKKLAKDSAGDINDLRNFLSDRGEKDLLNSIEKADDKICDLETDQSLIKNNYDQIAKINLEFCSKNDPTSYAGWFLLGTADKNLSENTGIFKELKPNFRNQAETAFENAYLADPTKSDPIDFLLALYKIDGNSQRVAYWQRMQENLSKIQGK
ncbi:MAG: hypothetical protein NTW79_02385 [Candidatus Berkelbacteria bacterium]|nr:hypothetical protein [Candidatus Berkelbacteria bacterium]